MSGHRKKPIELSPHEVESFVADASGWHQALIKHTAGLRTSGEHYRALADLHEAVCRAVMAMTGERVVPWARTPPASLGPVVPSRDE